MLQVGDKVRLSKAGLDGIREYAKYANSRPIYEWHSYDANTIGVVTEVHRFFAVQVGNDPELIWMPTWWEKIKEPFMHNFKIGDRVKPTNPRIYNVQVNGLPCRFNENTRAVVTKICGERADDDMGLLFTLNLTDETLWSSFWWELDETCTYQGALMALEA